MGNERQALLLPRCSSCVVDVVSVGVAECVDWRVACSGRSVGDMVCAVYVVFVCVVECVETSLGPGASPFSQVTA